MKFRERERERESIILDLVRCTILYVKDDNRKYGQKRLIETFDKILGSFICNLLKFRVYLKSARFKI